MRGSRGSRWPRRRASARSCSWAPTCAPANAQLVFTDWPLMDGRARSRASARGALAMFLHRVLALLGFLFVLWTMIRARDHERARSRCWCVSRPSRSSCSSPRCSSGAANVLTAAAAVGGRRARGPVGVDLGDRGRPGHRRRAAGAGADGLAHRRTTEAAGLATGEAKPPSATPSAPTPPHEAPHHRAAADHHRARDGPGRSAACPRSG